MEEQHQIFALLASMFVGSAAFLAVYQLLLIVAKSQAVSESGNPTPEERNRRLLCRTSKTYALAGYLIDELTPAVSRLCSPAFLEKIGMQLVLNRQSPPWRADRFLAAIFTEALLLGTAFGLFFLFLTDFALATAAFSVVFFLYLFLSVRHLGEQATLRQTAFKLRLPYVVDILALTLGAGTSLAEGLRVAARENANHPIGEEIHDMLHRMEMGGGQNESLLEMADRIREPDLDEAVFAINKAHDLGTPLAATLADLATQMRLKRQQWGEKISGEAEVKIMFPGLIIMVACLLLIIAPFILMALSRKGVLL